MDCYWIIKTVLPSGWVVKPFMGCAHDDLEITLPLLPFIAGQGAEGWQVCIGLAKVAGTWRIMPMTVPSVMYTILPLSSFHRLLHVSYFNASYSNFSFFISQAFQITYHPIVANCLPTVT